MQVKQSVGYSEQAINTLISTAHDLFDLNNALPALSRKYNAQLVAVIADYRRAINGLMDKFPRLEFVYYYATKGDSDQVHPNVTSRVSTLEEKIRSSFSDCDFTFHFLGARDLLTLARRQASSNMSLSVQEYLSAEREGIVCLVRLRDYYNFITDEYGRRRQVIFDANVREYEGDVEVNAGIRQTLVSRDNSVNFWWLNNGITIVASRAPLTGKTLTLENPKVVNGLQTSQEIFNYFTTNPVGDDDRELLVRVIVTDDEIVRNQVIKATNSQTKISPYSLRATDRIHNDIEQDFEHNGLYYDRQRNYYKNLGRPRNRIVTIPYLAQAIAAIVLQEPYNSRGRPTDLIKKDDKYNRVFSEDYDIAVYRKCAQFMRAIDEFLRRDADDYARKERTNLRFQLAMFVAVVMLKTVSVNPKDVAARLPDDDIDIEVLQNATRHVFDVYQLLKLEKRLDGDRIAKNQDYDERVIERVKAILSGDLALEAPISIEDR